MVKLDDNETERHSFEGHHFPTGENDYLQGPEAGSAHSVAAQLPGLLENAMRFVVDTHFLEDLPAKEVNQLQGRIVL